jgi:hypothetical protein
MTHFLSFFFIKVKTFSQKNAFYYIWLDAAHTKRCAVSRATTYPKIQPGISHFDKKFDQNTEN